MKKLLLISVMSLSLLAACGHGGPSSNSGMSSASNGDSTNTSNVTSNSSSSSADYTEEDLTFRGDTIPEDEVYQDYNSATFGGALSDLAVGAWLVAGYEYVIDVGIKDLEDQTISCSFSNPEVCAFEARTVNDVVTNYLLPLKTGSTTLEIRDANGDLIYRNIINARVPLKDVDVMFDVLYQADYWTGAFTSAAGYGYYTFAMSEDGNHNIITFSGSDSGESYGSFEFEVLLDSYTESNKDSFNIYSFDVQMISMNPSLNITYFDVSLAGDMVYIGTNSGLIDFFVPVYK